MGTINEDEGAEYLQYMNDTYGEDWEDNVEGRAMRFQDALITVVGS